MRLFASLALALLAGQASGGDLGGRVLLTYRDHGADGFDSDGFSQLYDARLEKQLTDPFRFRLTLRAEQNNGGADAGLGRISRHFSQFEPGAEIFYTLPRLQLQGTYDLLRTSSSIQSGLASERRLERVLGFASWRADRLPGLAFQAERRAVEDTLAKVDRSETILHGTLDYAWKGLSLTGISRRTDLDDGELVFARSTRENQGLLGYEGSFFGGRVSTSMSGLLSSTRLDERASSVPVTVLTPVPLARAYRSVDDTPLQDDERPFELPSLVDGNLERSTGASLGPDGAFYQNFSFDLGRFATLDAFRVHLRDPQGRLVPFGGPIAWDVFVSADGERWTSVSAGVIGSFVPALSLYEIRFATSSARYFKLVSFQTNTVACLITEIQAFTSSGFDQGETRRTDIVLKSGNLSLTVEPVRRLMLSYYGLYNTVAQASQAAEISNRSLDHLLSAQLDPWRAASLILRYQNRDLTQTGIVFDQAYDAWSGILELRPLASATQSLELTRSREQNTGRRITSSTLILHTYTRIYPSLDLTLDFGGGRQEYSGIFGLPGSEFLAQNVDRRYLTGVSRAQLTRSITLTLAATLQRAEYEAGFPPPVSGGGLLPPDGIALPPERDDRWSAEVYYRPGSRLGVSARVGRAVAGSITGILQRYHLDWYPFAGGALALGATYDQDVDSISSRQARRLTLTPTWTINRRAVMNLNYTLLSISGPVTSSARTLYTTLTLTL